jgi:hypothetical protein
MGNQAKSVPFSQAKGEFPILATFSGLRAQLGIISADLPHGGCSHQRVAAIADEIDGAQIRQNVTFISSPRSTRNYFVIVIDIVEPSINETNCCIALYFSNLQLDLLWRPEVVSIERRNIFSLRMRNSQISGRGNTAVRLHQHTRSRIIRCELRRDLVCGIGRPVIHDEDLKVPIGLPLRAPECAQ